METELVHLIIFEHKVLHKYIYLYVIAYSTP